MNMSDYDRWKTREPDPCDSYGEQETELQLIYEKIARLRESHDALLAAAKEAIAVLDEFINRNFGGEVDLKPRELAAVMAMKAAIDAAEEQAP